MNRLCGLFVWGVCRAGREPNSVSVCAMCGKKKPRTSRNLNKH